MKSRTVARIAGNRGAALRSDGLVDPDGRGVIRAVWVDQRAPRLALAPAYAVAQHLDKADLDDDARRFPRERLPANEVGIGRPLAGGLRVKGDQPVETVEEIQLVHYILRSNVLNAVFTPSHIIDRTRAGRLCALAPAYRGHHKSTYHLAVATAPALVILTKAGITAPG
jgi:hypothetical protein